MRQDSRQSLFNGGPIPVLLMVRELNHGGVERDVAKIAIHIDRRRFLPHVATYSAKGMRFEELAAAGVPVLEIPLSSFVSRRAAAGAVRLGAYLRQNRIRVVHAYDPIAVFCAPVARAVRVPVVLSSQLGSRDLLDSRSRRLLRWSDKIVDGFVVNCEAMRRHLVEDEHIRPDAIHLCYNGVDTRQFFPLDGEARPDPVRDASLVIGAICVLRPEKALDLLQEAFARVRHLDPRMKLLIVGSGPELPKLQANATRLNIADACCFQPSTPEVPKFLRAIDIFALCSHSEAFSNALLEAMACGCASVGSRVGGTPELTGEDERGLLFRAGDVADMADKLAMLIANEPLRRELSRRAAAFARESLSIEVAVERTAAIYEQELTKKKRPVSG
ncbi:MAG: glycosyltransferase family 4 protein [Acidobacteria bacterium]|nr:glycosyltransferase family 4 protein [Acidobacteriota bacterium]